MYSLLSFIILMVFSLSVFGEEHGIARDRKGYPRCVENIEGKNLFLKYARRSITRAVRFTYSSAPCRRWKTAHLTRWKILDQVTKEKLPELIQFQLEQLEKKTIEFREEKTAAEFIDKRNITTYTSELNREITPKYGAIFSAEVFKELVERKPGNREFREYVLNELKKKSAAEPFSEWKDRVKLVVSFGLGWSDDFGIAAPYYIKDFLADIESLGLEVVYLNKNPFGTVKKNVARIIPQIENELQKDKKIIFLSLCKGTPELLSALASIRDPGLREKIAGHVNLSGMLSGTFFADITMSVIVPKLMSPFLKIIPIKEMRDAGKMASSASYMKSTVISETLSEVKGNIPDDTLTVNVTGAPMSDRVLRNGSPMAPVLKYNYWQKFLVSANDGFIELPHTLISEELAPNQVTLVLDSSHMLADGYLDEHELSKEDARRALYQSILRFILKKN